MVNLRINLGMERQLSRWTTLGVALTAVALGFVVLYRANHHPRTDDAENFCQLYWHLPASRGADHSLECAGQPVREEG